MSTSRSSLQAGPTNCKPVGSPSTPKPLGTEIAGTPTAFAAPMGEVMGLVLGFLARTLGQASAKLLSTGLATVARDGATSRSNVLNISAQARRIGARRPFACR